MKRFFEKLFGKREPIEKESHKQVKVNLNLNNILKFIEDETSEFSNKINDSIKTSFDQIKTLLDELEINLDILEKAKSEKDVDDRPKMFALDHRIAFIKRVQSFKNTIKLPESENTQKVFEFNNLLIDELNNLIKDTAKNIYFTKILFSEEISGVASTLKKISGSIDQSKKYLDENRDKIKLIIDIKKNITDMDNQINIKQTENDNLKQHKLNLIKLEDEEKKIHHDLTQLDKSGELTDLKQKQAKLDTLKKDIDESKTYILQMFSPIMKALKKFERYTTGLTKDEIQILDTYIEHPSEGLLIDTHLKTLDKILENIESLINTDQIQLKDKLKEKAITQIEKFKKHSELEYFKTKSKTTQETIKTLENEIKTNKTSHKIESIRTKFQDIKNKIKDEKQDIDKLEEYLKTLNNDISEKIKELESDLKDISDKTVTIKF